MLAALTDRLVPLFGYDAFISYTHLDGRAYAVRLQQRLRDDLGYFVFLDSEELAIGDSLTEVIARALHRSQLLVVLVTPGSERSDWVRLERETFARRRAGARVAEILLGGSVSDPSGLWFDEGGLRAEPSAGALKAFQQKNRIAKRRQGARAVAAIALASVMGLSAAAGVVGFGYAASAPRRWFVLSPEYPFGDEVVLRDSDQPVLRFRSVSNYAQSDEDYHGVIRVVDIDLSGATTGCALIRWDTLEGASGPAMACQDGATLGSAANALEVDDPNDANPQYSVDLPSASDRLVAVEDYPAARSDIEAERWFASGGKLRRAVAVADPAGGIVLTGFENATIAWTSPPLPSAPASQVTAVAWQVDDVWVALRAGDDDGPSAPAGALGWQRGAREWRPLELPRPYSGWAIADMVRSGPRAALLFSEKTTNVAMPPPGVPGLAVWEGEAMTAIAPPAGATLAKTVLVGLTSAGDVVVRYGDANSLSVAVYRSARFWERVADGLGWRG